jgi:hypothetical protein
MATTIKINKQYHTILRLVGLFNKTLLIDRQEKRYKAKMMSAIPHDK